MKLQKKRFLLFVLISVLFVLPSAEVSAYGIHDCMKWIQHSDRALFLSKLSRNFLPIAVLTSIAALSILRWYKKRNIRQPQAVGQGVANRVAEEQNEGELKDKREEKFINSIIGEVSERVIDDVEECSRVKQFVTKVLEDDGGEEQNGVMFGERVAKEYLTSGRIKCGEKSMPGVKCSLFNGVVVQQLAVLHQDTEAQIDGQLIPVGAGSAGCAYQSIKNALMLLIQGCGSRVESLNSTDVARHLFAMSNDKQVSIGIWREKVIKNYRNGDDDGEWLSGEEIARLIGEIKNFKAGYFVIESVDALDLFVDDVERAKSTIRQNSNDPYVFFVNTGGESEGADGQLIGRDGHWFTMVSKEVAGKRIYTIMDSKNIVRLHNDQWVKKVIETFEDVKGAAGNFVLSRGSLDAIKNGIEQLLNSRDENGNDEQKSMKLQVLTDRFQSWGGKVLPEVLQNRISGYLVDD